jgi:transcriptional regulator with XRE-family HTH domain
MIAASQIRAARALLDWSQTQLADAAGLSLPTIKRMEGERGPGRSSAENVEAVRRALIAAGAELIPAGDYQGGGGPGVRLRG